MNDGENIIKDEEYDDVIEQFSSDFSIWFHRRRSKLSFSRRISPKAGTSVATGTVVTTHSCRHSHCVVLNEKPGKADR